MSKRAVRLPEEALIYLGSPREWGLPNGLYEGRCFHSARDGTITCALPLAGGRSTGQLELDTRPLQHNATNFWMPRTWHRAMASYALKWPSSGELQAFLSDVLTAQQRLKKVEQLTAKLLDGLRASFDGNAQLSAQVRVQELAAWIGFSE